MNFKTIILAGALASLPAAFSSDKPLTVVASLPDFADIAREIGGNRISVESMAKGIEDTHAVPVRPSLAAKLARADVLIEMGLEMEHAWLPSLVEASNNPRIKGAGRIVASEGIVPKEVPVVVSRTEGEQHPEGNPHVNIGPEGGRVFAQNICEGLVRNAPGNKEEFEANLKRYLEKLDKKETEWKAAAEKLKGVKYVSFHPDMIYLADFLGMEQLGTIEPKPGIPPSASHTAELIKLMKARKCDLVIREPQYPEGLANEVASQGGAKVVKLAIMVNGLPEATTWIGLIDANIKALLDAMGKK